MAAEHSASGSRRRWPAHRLRRLLATSALAITPCAAALADASSVDALRPIAKALAAYNFEAALDALNAFEANLT